MVKFSFPLPGRKSNKDKAVERVERQILKPSSGWPSPQSKAQRILGTGHDLNIDSPTQSDKPSWGYPSSRSSGMSISISESTFSTKSTNETGSWSGSNADQWEQESGVFPRRPGQQRLHEKASSTILGQPYGDDGATDASSISRRMRHETSDSTLKSYYDRQNSPLAISQQTSASSARDLALRKGCPQINRSPLLQVESLNAFESNFVGNKGNLSRETSKNKPNRLDLSSLFGSRKNGPESLLSPASAAGSISRLSSSSRRKLTKKLSKESLQSLRSTQSSDLRRGPSTGDYNQNNDHWSVRSTPTPLGKIPESRVPDRATQERENGSKQPEQTHFDQSQNPGNSHLSPSDGQGFSWKHIRSSMSNQPWESSSAASISSRNTRTSRQTSSSALSNTDLKQSSVLSLSSDSEGDSDAESLQSPASSSRKDRASRVLIGETQRRTDSRYQPVSKPQPSNSQKHSSRKNAALASPFHPLPESALPNSRIFGPWSPPDHSNHRESANSQQLDKGERRNSKRTSMSSRLSSQNATPPLSPPSLEPSARSSRYMAVTRQEEQLLEALRQKRARMKEQIIEEHEIAKTPTPPRIPKRRTSQYSTASSVSTVRGPDGSSNKGHILLYLDNPMYNVPVDATEPSPDLSDFLSFGSDEDSTPRTSWMPPQKERDRLRSDSSIRRGDKVSPIIPPSAARLSAVGNLSADFQTLRAEREEGPKKRGANVGVRFVEEDKVVNSQDFLLDENETDVIWGMN